MALIALLIIFPFPTDDNNEGAADVDMKEDAGNKTVILLLGLKPGTNFI